MNLIELLQLGFLYIALAVIVSLDVFALTLTITKKELVDDNKKVENDRRHAWGKLNATMHAGLLLFYLTAFSLVFDPSWIAYLLELFRHPWLVAIAEWFRVLALHMPVFFGVFAILWVWVSYRNKIIDEPEDSNPGKLDRFQRWIFTPARRVVISLRVIKPVTEDVDVDSWSLKAFLVAVDMLALAALVKSMPAVDNWYKILTLFVVVWCVVYGMSRLAARSSDKWMNTDGLSQDSKIAIRVLLRLLEPLLIFYFAVELMVFLILGYNVSSPSYFLAAAFLLGGIISYHGFDKIVAAATKE